MGLKFIFESKPFTQSISSYFEKYGVHNEILNRYNVHNIQCYEYLNSIGNWLQVESSEHDPIIGYMISDDCIKIYRPFNKQQYKHLWLGKKPSDYHEIYGLTQLPPEGDFLFITEGFKDALTINANGLLAIGLDNASTKIPVKIIAGLRTRFDCIILLLDNDEAGIKGMTKLSEDHNLPYIVLPPEINLNGSLIEGWGKDVSDLRCYPGVDKKEFEAVILKQANIAIQDYEAKELNNEQNSGITIVKANDRIQIARSLPPPVCLAGELFFTNEIVILAGDTGSGKSVMAVQLADCIAKGKGIFDLVNDSPPLKVLYLDYELTDAQFLKRYSNHINESYRFSDNLNFINIDFNLLYDNNQIGEFSKILFIEIEKAVIKNGASVIIINNITVLHTESPTDSQVGLELMRLLIDLKKETGITVIVLAPTPKFKSFNSFELNHVAGSKMIVNFADSVIGLGKSVQASDIRYIKQLKVRSAEMIFDTNNVISCRLKKHNAFLGFDFLAHEQEKEHLGVDNKNGREVPESVFKVAELLKKGKSYRDIASILSVAPGTISKWKTRYPEIFGQSKGNFTIN